jgi:large subunit ribosomal protein L29
MSELQAQEELATLRRQLFDLRLQLKRGEVKNNRQFAQIRADVARLMHHLSELRMTEALAVAGALEAPRTRAPKPPSARAPELPAAEEEEE